MAMTPRRGPTATPAQHHVVIGYQLVRADVRLWLSSAWRRECFICYAFYMSRIAISILSMRTCAQRR